MPSAASSSAALLLLLLPRPPPSAAPKSFVLVLSPSKPYAPLSLSSSLRLSLSFPSKSLVSSPSLPAALSPRSPPSSSAVRGGAEGAEGAEGERVFFEGGAHYGDLVANLALGLTLLWLPLTLAAVSRAFFLRYRFTDRRVTVVSGLTGQDRADFPYAAVADVKAVPRFVGEWGDIVITLTDGTKLDLRSVPKFRDIADYCLFMADRPASDPDPDPDPDARPRGF